MTDTISRDTIRSILHEFVTEAYAGPQQRATWFVSNDPQAGIFGTLEPLTAEQASQSVAGGKPIAAHVEHLRWSLENVNRTLRGEPWNPDWSASWCVQTVDELAWNELQTELRKEVEALLGAVDDLDDLSDRMVLTGLLALAPHAAYHLGAIRQLARLVRTAQ